MNKHPMEHIKIKGLKGLYYVIDSQTWGGTPYLLLESELYGDETESVVITAFDGDFTEYQTKSGRTAYLYAGNEMYYTYDGIAQTLLDNEVLDTTLNINWG